MWGVSVLSPKKGVWVRVGDADGEEGGDKKEEAPLFCTTRQKQLLSPIANATLKKAGASWREGRDCDGDQTWRELPFTVSLMISRLLSLLFRPRVFSGSGALFLRPARENADLVSTSKSRQ